MNANDTTNPQGYGKPQRWVDRTGGPTLDELSPLRWHARAACNGLPPSLWLDDYVQAAYSPAVTICRSCPVRRTCLASALVFDDAYGIYGGTTTTERAKLARRLRRGDTLGHVLDLVLGPIDAAASSAPSRTRGAA